MHLSLFRQLTNTRVTAPVGWVHWLLGLGFLPFRWVLSLTNEIYQTMGMHAHTYNTSITSLAIKRHSLWRLIGSLIVTFINTAFSNIVIFSISWSCIWCSTTDIL